ncbi:MAG: hypothetical protein H7831_10335 [Magnetococcus sp. WYHC-3]
MRLQRGIIAGTLALLLSALALLQHYRAQVDVDAFRLQAVQLLQQVTGLPVDVASVALSPTHGLFSLVIQNLTLGSSRQDDPPLLVVDQVVLGFSAWELLLQGRVRLNEAILVRPQFNLVKHAGHSFIDRAHKTARAGSSRLEDALGLKMTDLGLDTLMVRDGLLSVMDWEHPDGRTLIVDQLFFEVHDLSSTAPAPMNGLARFQLVPFTLSGRIGPLPESLSLLDLPVVASIEAKAPNLTHLVDTFSARNLAVESGRSYFSSLLHGSLSQGVVSHSWLHVNNMKIRTPDHQLPDPVDVAMRQKSLLRWNDGQPNLKVEEFFLYLENQPLLALTGQMQLGQFDRLHTRLTLQSLAPLPLHLWPDDRGWPQLSGQVEGKVTLAGWWPDGLQVGGELILDQTRLQWPEMLHLVKEQGHPLRTRLSVQLAPHQVVFKDTIFYQPRVNPLLEQPLFSLPAENRMRLSGTIPGEQLSLSGSWELADLGQMFPRLAGIPLEGPTWFQMELGTGEVLSQGRGRLRSVACRVGDLELKNLESDIVLDGDQWVFSPLSARLAEGWLEAGVLLNRRSEPLVHAAFDLSGAAVEQLHLPGMAASDNLTQWVNLDRPQGGVVPELRGLLTAHGVWSGQLRQGFSSVTQSLQAHLLLRPGALTHVREAALLQGATAPSQGLLQKGERMVVLRAEADVGMRAGEDVQVRELQLESTSGGYQGQGTWSREGELALDLRWRDLEGKLARMHIAGRPGQGELRMTPQAQTTGE